MSNINNPTNSVVTGLTPEQLAALGRVPSTSVVSSLLNTAPNVLRTVQLPPTPRPPLPQIKTVARASYYMFDQNNDQLMATYGMYKRMRDEAKRRGSH